MPEHESSSPAQGSSPPGWQPSGLSGVTFGTLRPIADERGSFTELWRSSWTRGFGADIRQANLSRSEPGVLRGLHVHERQADLWVLLEGRAFVALVDLRDRLDHLAAATATATFEMTFGSAVHIPAGVAHGFLALERVALLYMVTNEYTGTDEHGFAWNDPMAAVQWPIRSPILSRRDATNPSLEEALEAMRQRADVSPTR
ncbi:MAG: dTDP-4-dehydrorhamnose 3,5-epimerase family protein [Chloroflexi bacterium]|nr:dTDP-4-dehydrorhamnose 3,5-epimerase family protein [Chloroflexota bacterium]